MSTDIGTWNDVDREVTRTVATTLAELRAPLMRSLDLNLGGRWDHFSDLDPIFTWSSALAWQASTDLQLRISYGTSFRVPTLYEISRHSVQIPISDPRQGGETASVTALIGSSPELKSVRGRSANFTATFTPGSFPDLRLSASYWRTPRIVSTLDL